MAKTHHLIPTDRDLRPAYYDDFHCIMGACQYNCCDDSWRIEFSRKDYLKVKHAPKSPELEELTGKCMRRLRGRAHDDMYAGFQASDAGRCAFHSPEGLCRLQLECGEEVLPKVCRVFPRMEVYMPSGYLERSLSPGCEGVLALLWELPEGIEFRSDPLPREQRGLRTPREGDELFLWFSEMREWCVDVLQDRRFPLPQRIFLMGMGLKELAEGEEDMERWKARAAALAESADLSGVLPTGERELGMYLSSCAHTLLAVRNMTKKSRMEISIQGESARTSLNGEDLSRALSSPAAYRAARARFEERFGGREYFMENLMVSVFFHLQMPDTESRDKLWKGYVNFCNLYAFYRYLAVMSCREGEPGDREELFRLIVFASRMMLHGRQRQMQLRDEFFRNDSATLAHMAILLCG